MGNFSNWDLFFFTLSQDTVVWRIFDYIHCLRHIWPIKQKNVEAAPCDSFISDVVRLSATTESTGQDKIKIMLIVFYDLWLFKNAKVGVGMA